MYHRLTLLAAGALLGALAIGFSLAAPGAQPALALTNCETSTAALDANESALFEQLNTYRQQNGLAPVKVSPNLSRAAAWVTEDMVSKGYFNHFEPNGRTPFQRAYDCGYPSQNVGENLVITGSASNAMTLWKSSPQHNANMLKSQWKVVGIGRAGAYWAMVFGATDDTGTISGPNPSPQNTATPTASPTPKPTATPGPHQPSPLPIRRAMLQMIASE